MPADVRVPSGQCPGTLPPSQPERSPSVEIAEVKQNIRGPLAPVLSVFKSETLEVDLDAIQSNVDQQIRRGMTKGSAVLLAAGAGGDFPLLSFAERKAVIRAVAEAAAGRATVLGCAQCPLTADAVALAEWSQKVGCYGIQLSPTWYYPPNEAQIYEHFKAVASSIDICVMVYHTPWLDSHMSIDLIKRLWTDFGNIRSIKWSASDEHEVMDGYIQLADQYAIIDNGSAVPQAALLGATGFVTHLANAWPEHDVALWNTWEAGDHAAGTAEFVKVNWVWRELRGWAAREISGGESFLVKPAAEMCGFVGGPSRPPMVTLNETQRAHVREVMVQIGATLV